MRILLVNKFAHLEGGSARYILDLYDLLKAKGHEVAFFAMKPTQGDAQFVRKDLLDEWGKYWVSPVQTRKASYGMEGLRTAFRSLWSFEAQKRIDQLIADFRPDIVHLNSIQRQLSPSIIMAVRRRNIPMVMTVHGYELVYPHYFLMVDQLDRCRRGFYLQTIMKKEMRHSYLLSALTWFEFVFHRLLGVYQHIDAFICPSSFLSTLMSGAGYRCVIHLSNFYPVTRADVPLLGNNYIFVARLSEEKGILELLEAYRMCIRKGLMMPKLVLYSRTGPLLEMIDRLIDHSELRGTVERQPFLGHEAFADMFQSARVVMIPSYPYLENFPYAVTEAFSFGRPVLSSGLGGLSEMVQDGVNGWNVLGQTENVNRETYIERLSQALERAIQTPEDELREKGQKGFEYVSRLSPEWYYEELMKIYNRVIRGNPKLQIPISK